MTDFDLPKDAGPEEPEAILPWESIDPDEPVVAVMHARTVEPRSPYDPDRDWAATAFLADEEPIPALPVRADSANEHRNPPVVEFPAMDSPVEDAPAEEETCWRELEPVMAEISAASRERSDPASTFARSDAIFAAASELATLAQSMQTIAAPAQADAAPRRTAAPKYKPELAATALLDPEPDAEPETQTSFQPDVNEPIAVTAHGGWTIPLMCLGIGLIACCVVVPQGDFNRRLRYEQASLEINLKSIEKQAAVNEEFLKKVADDPELAERLSSRQLKTIRKGRKIIPLDRAPGEERADMSPFGLVAVAPPPALQPYRPIRGTIADLCNNARTRLYVMGTAAMMIAVGLVMGLGETPGTANSE